MNPLLATILGIIEGLTEFLPISSTGHLNLASHFLSLEGPGIAAFNIVIQLGAILAVVVHYRALLLRHVNGIVARKSESVALATGIVVAFLPLSVVGLLFHKAIKTHLEGPTPIAIALIVGGVVMLAATLYRRGRGAASEEGLEKVTRGRALLIGLGQCFAVFPGASRSMTTIVAGELSGLGTATAAEFSFLLSIPTIAAATLYEGWKERHVLAEVGALNIGIGFTVSFFVAWAVIAGFLKYLKRHGLAPFGVYRIIVGGLLLWLTASGK